MSCFCALMARGLEIRAAPSQALRELGDKCLTVAPVTATITEGPFTTAVCASERLVSPSTPTPVTASVEGPGPERCWPGVAVVPPEEADTDGV